MDIRWQFREKRSELKEIVLKIFLGSNLLISNEKLILR